MPLVAHRFNHKTYIYIYIPLVLKGLLSTNCGLFGSLGNTFLTLRNYVVNKSTLIMLIMWLNLNYGIAFSGRYGNVISVMFRFPYDAIYSNFYHDSIFLIFSFSL